MTKQEAEVWVARLTRIWKPDGNVETLQWIFKHGHLRFYVDVTPDFRLTFIKSGNRREQPVAVLNFRTLTYPDEFWIEYDEQGEIIENYYDSVESKWLFYQRVADQWRFYFRRALWLSGCPIEASAHEKAEWIQGFTSEELEAWNLKF